MKKCLLLALLIACLTAQSQKIKKYNNKKFSKKNYFFSIYDLDIYPPYGGLYVVQPDQAFWGIIKDDISPVTISADKNDPVTFNKVDSFALSNRITGKPIDYIATNYFPEGFVPSFDPNSMTNLKKHYLKRIKYRDYKLVVQALTVPLKFRGKVDTLTYTTETGANFALGTGLKWGINWFHSEKNIFGLKTTTLSFTPGALLGLSAVSLKGGTNASADFKARNEPVFSYGAFFMVGLNSINIGFSIGKDVALKDGGKSGGWIYNHKTWTGITVGLDVIK